MSQKTGSIKLHVTEVSQDTLNWRVDSAQE